MFDPALYWCNYGTMSNAGRSSTLMRLLMLISPAKCVQLRHAFAGRPYVTHQTTHAALSQHHTTHCVVPAQSIESSSGCGKWPERSRCVSVADSPVLRLHRRLPVVWRGPHLCSVGRTALVRMSYFNESAHALCLSGFVWPVSSF